MARAAGHTDTDLIALKNSLEEDVEQYSFTQVIRLLRLVLKKTDDRFAREEFWERIRIRPALALGFPHMDIDTIKWGAEGKTALLDVNFFGLYGVSSPLPTFYTEDLIDYQNNDNTAPRDFLDIIHGALYPLLYDSWKKHRLSLRAYEDEEESVLEWFHTFTGLSDSLFREADPLYATTLRYAGLLTQHPRSAKALESILSDVLGQVPVTVEQCPKKTVPIPKDQLLILGKSLRLGEETVLGETLTDRINQIRIRVGPVENDGFDRLLPGNEDLEKVAFWYRFYLIEPVMADIEIILSDQSPRPICLGDRVRTRLGLDSWLENGSHTSRKHVVFSLHANEMEGDL
jgi:type VI secretion system protein ImpH